MELARGKAWKVGHDLERDSAIFPFRYVLEAGRGVPLEQLARHVLEPVSPDFGTKVKKGDFLVVGRNFGHGKTHKEGIACLKILGIAAVIADSFLKTLVKNSVYLGLPLLTGDGLYDMIHQDDELEVSLDSALIKNLSTGDVLKAELVIPPDHPLYRIVEAGGQIEYVRKRLISLQSSGR
jgi:3-isopropylmalate/(R)-2-methylmalate dehydratase small subunit